MELITDDYHKCLPCHQTWSGCSEMTLLSRLSFLTRNSSGIARIIFSLIDICSLHMAAIKFFQNMYLLFSYSFVVNFAFSEVKCWKLRKL